jgi:hypothetical protein
LISHGIYRWCVLLPFVVVKVVRAHNPVLHWSQTPRDVNLAEAARSRAGLPVAPVLWCSPKGTVVVARRVRVHETGGGAARACLPVWRRLIAAGVAVEPKTSSFGRLRGRTVALDYGDTYPTSEAVSIYDLHGWVDV